MKYDYLVVGAGLFGAVFAHEMRRAGKKCLVIDRREHVGGNVYTEEVHGIQVHQYGAHIFHTSDRRIWDYVNCFARFNHYVNAPIAVYREEVYNLPFNMNTFSRMWGVRTPGQARRKIEEQCLGSRVENPQNVEEQALSLVGRDIYEKLVKGYTEKQWGRSCRELPAFLLRRLPVRFTYDNNYFSDRYQGIPEGGYTGIVERMLEGIPVCLGISYRDFQKKCGNTHGGGNGADTFGKVLYTGMVDEYFRFSLGELQYRSLRFEQEVMENVENYQGNAVVNYTDREVPYTRIIEHKHFEFGTQPDTVVTREYPAPWERGSEPYYPVNDEHNNALFARYQSLARREKGVLFGGRLGQYRYYDMDQVIAEALAMAERES
ncbi:MAG: UDP-galactopyranose mutase [Clostridium sp.]|jgi:UDP-galactopyranose mutase|nr:UDP-galactopyranose mutase [Clostridium sp.]